MAPLFRTQPLAPDLQPPYLNTAALAQTAFAPDEVLTLAKALEFSAGRRLGPRHGARPLDIDLLLYGSFSSSRPELTLPHPGLRQRRFVLAPLAAIAPDFAVPPDGATVAQLLATVGTKASVVPVDWESAGSAVKPATEERR